MNMLRTKDNERLQVDMQAIGILVFVPFLFFFAGFGFGLGFCEGLKVEGMRIGF
jgi:hypothetical protein